jgi:UDP-N-acetyl-2-amino-2-deoxyglucuronate dehydrogenase
MTQKKIKTALIGCGKVGHTHAQALQRAPQSELVAVCDVSAGRAAEFAAKYHTRPFTDVASMLSETGAQLVSICTPHPVHVQAILAAAEQGAHVLVEKPLAPALAGCDLAIGACRIHGVKLGVISQRRLYPPVVRLHQAIAAGKIDQPIVSTCVVMGWRSPEYYQMDAWRGKWDSEGGGVLVNQTVHQLDVFQWLMGPIDELFGYWDNFNHPYIEVEDTAVALIRFQSGAIGQVLVSNSMKPGFYGKIHVHGSNGASVGVQTEGGSPFVAGVTTAVEPPYNDVWTVPGEEDLLPAWQADDRLFADQHDIMSYFHYQQIDDMLGAILEGREPMVNGDEGRKSVELFSAIYRSQRNRAPISFPLQAEIGQSDYDGRLGYTPYSKRSESAQ